MEGYTKSGKIQWRNCFLDRAVKVPRGGPGVLAAALSQRVSEAAPLGRSFRLWGYIAFRGLRRAFAAEECAPGQQSLNGRNEISSRLGLLNVTVRAEGTHIARHSFRFVHRENQNAAIFGQPGD